MLRCGWMALVLMVAAGCLPLRPEKDQPRPHVVQAPPIQRTFARVTPQQVTRENARDMSAALWDEMDQAEQGDLLPELNSPGLK